MDGAVNHECCCVEKPGLATADDIAFFIDVDQVRLVDQRERNSIDRRVTLAR